MRHGIGRHANCVIRFARVPHLGGPGTLDHFSVMESTAMQWTTPTFEDLRFGFEITMYVAAR